MTDTLDEVLGGLKALREHVLIEEERESLSESLHLFVQQAWKVLKPQDTYRDNWHIKAICEHLEAVSRGEILRLQIWVPPGTMKSLNVSIFWPVWEWCKRPSLTYYSASYALDLSWQHCSKSRDLIQSPWYQERWGETVHLTKAGVSEYENSVGGRRTATAPGSGGVGKHGHRIILDDLLDASDAQATTRTELDKTNDWYDSVIFGRAADPKTTAQVIIMQRLHEDDIAAHAYRKGEDEWTILCLPERFESNHPHRWPKDPRTYDGELLWPEHRGEKESDEAARGLLSFRAAGQLQQRPAAREGEILKRDWWRFYDPRHRGDAVKLPRFGMIVLSVDCPSKDKESNDLVAIQAYGISGADRYLLDLDKGHMNYSKAKRRVKEMATWARKLWPRTPHYLLIENAGYGIELIIDLKRELTGVVKISPSADGNKITRAESACDALESGNVFLPGYGPPWQPAIDESRCPSDVADFINNAALFPNAAHDDDVDAWSQAMNWLRGRAVSPLRTTSALKRIVGRS